IRSAQLEILLAQLTDLLPLSGREQVGSLPGVRLGLAHAFAQHLRADTEITRDLRDRTPGLQRETDTAVKQLLRVLPGSWHKRGVPCSRDKSLVSRSPRKPACLNEAGEAGEEQDRGGD